MELRSTRDVARLLGVGVSRLARAVWEGRIEAPLKGPGGAYLWNRRDVERASWALRHRNADDVLCAEGGAQ